MSFLLNTIAIPVWLLILVLISVLPVWLIYLKKIYKKRIKKILSKKSFSGVKDSGKSLDEVLKKATYNSNTQSRSANKEAESRKGHSEHSINHESMPYVKIVLKTLALKGDSGMLLQSMADALKLSNSDIKSSLEYLENNEFIEAVSGGLGTKYYLIQRGRKYCIKRGYIQD